MSAGEGTKRKTRGPRGKNRRHTSNLFPFCAVDLQRYLRTFVLFEHVGQEINLVSLYRRYRRDQLRPPQPSEQRSKRRARRTICCPPAPTTKSKKGSMPASAAGEFSATRSTWRAECVDPSPLASLPPPPPPACGCDSAWPITQVSERSLRVAQEARSSRSRVRSLIDGEWLTRQGVDATVTSKEPTALQGGAEALYRGGRAPGPVFNGAL